MDFRLNDKNVGGTFAQNQSFSKENPAFNNTEDSRMYRVPCDGRFSWTVHGPLIVVCVLIIVFNGVVIALMHRKESLRTCGNIILVSLALSDLMSGLIGIPLIFGCSITNTAATPPTAACVCSVLFMRFMAISTVLHFALVACDRYVMIIFPMTYQTLVTLPRAVFALITIWLIPPVVATMQLAWYKNENLREKKEEDAVYMLILIVAFVGVPLLSMLCLYGHIIVLCIRHLYALRARRANLGNGTSSSRSIGRDFRGTVILISMLVVFAGCWLPAFFLMVLQKYIKVPFMPSFSWVLCYILFARFIPPMTNPLFCVLGKRDFRNALRAWVTTFRGNLCYNMNRPNVSMPVLPFLRD